MDPGLGDFGTVTSQLATKARLLASQAAAGPGGAIDLPPGLGAPDGPPELGAVGLARELGVLAGAALRLAVERAQNGGRSWEEIGGRLGVSPQVAYQRFGRAPGVAPEAAPVVVTDAGDRAVTVLTNWLEERYDQVAATFDETLAKTLPVDGLVMLRTQAMATAGAYQRLGDREPLVRQAGDYTVADVPLMFAGGLMKGRVSFDRSGRVVGLYVLPPGTP
jgi:hypothetical protein